MSATVQDPALRAASLAKANEIRIARAHLKAAIYERHAAGHATLAALIVSNDELVRTMRVYELLGWGWRIGASKIPRILSAAGASEYKRMGDLSDRQRRAIAHELVRRTEQAAA